MISTGPATPPEKHIQHVLMIEVVWSKIYGLGVEVASCWYAIGESALEGSAASSRTGKRFVRSKGSQISCELRCAASSGFEPA
jgi:hypothetical protein